MGTYMNPLTGSGWSNQPPQNTILSGANPIQLPGLQGGSATGEHGSFGGGAYGNPGSFGDMGSASSLQKNVLLNNVIAGQMKNALAPQFASLMGRYGGDAGNFFEQLMNLGSPFYKQKQSEAFTQGVGQNQNAAAMAQQQLARQGYGYSPSGANAAMIGGMNIQGGQNLAEQYLQQLFQNEQLQAGGAQGLSSLAGLFNPTQLLSGTAAGSSATSPSSWGNALGLLNAISGSGGVAGMI